MTCGITIKRLPLNNYDTQHNDTRQNNTSAKILNSKIHHDGIRCCVVMLIVVASLPDYPNDFVGETI
jgi:hypothetical protein